MRPLIRLLLLPLLLLLLVACEHAPKLRPLGPDAVVLAFGDSLTRGSSAPEGQSYPDVLAGLLGCTVINAGVPGEETARGRARLPELLEEVEPQLVILIHGGNDFLRRRDRGETEENLRAMLHTIRDSGADAVLLAVPSPNLLADPPDFYADLAEEFRIPFDDELLPDILTDRGLKADPIHPNADGYRKLAEGIARLLAAAQRG